MQKVFHPGILDSEISCGQCTWQGKGQEVNQEFLFLTDAIELYCPHCNVYLGFIDQDGDDVAT